MSLYKYIATDQKGIKRSGIVDARTEDLAVSLLKNQGYFVINLEKQKTNFNDLFNSVMGIPQSEIVSFTRQFSTMISAGLPAARALEVLGDQATNKNLKVTINSVLRDIEGGASLSDAFGKYPRSFSPTYKALVRAGESSGKLDEILKRLATSMEADRELRAKFQSAMIYPSIVMLAMIGVFVLMMIFVIPKLADLYESMNVELPLMTKIMIGASDFLIQRFYVVLAAAVGAFFGIRAFVKSKQGKEIITRVTFALPVFGKINRLRDITQFTRTLALLVSSAVPIVESLKIVSNVVGSTYYKKGALEAASLVEKGSPLSDYFKRNKNFPALVGQMAGVGEETGQLDEVLYKVAEYYNAEVSHAVEGLSAALEPLILIMLGAGVGAMIISIITPIYKITTSL